MLVYIPACDSKLESKRTSSLKPTCRREWRMKCKMNSRISVNSLYQNSLCAATDEFPGLEVKQRRVCAKLLDKLRDIPLNCKVNHVICASIVHLGVLYKESEIWIM